MEASHDNNTWEVLCDKGSEYANRTELLLSFSEEVPTGRLSVSVFLENDKAALTEVIVKGIVLE